MEYGVVPEERDTSWRNPLPHTEVVAQTRRYLSHLPFGHSLTNCFVVSESDSRKLLQLVVLRLRNDEDGNARVRVVQDCDRWQVLLWIFNAVFELLASSGC